MITELTAEQEAMLAEVRDEWLTVGLSTEPADRAAAEDGVRAAYRRAGLTPPRVMVWLDSPLAGCIGAAVLGDQVWDQVGAKARDLVWAQVRDQVGAQVREQVRGQVAAQVGVQVRAQVGVQVMDQVMDQVGAQVWDQVEAAVQGQHDAGFLGWCDALRRIGVTVDVDGLSLVARNAGWWWPMRDAVILTDRPDTLHRDPQGRLHCTTGPALRYRDGWSIYAIHGERVPADLIETARETTP